MAMNRAIIKRILFYNACNFIIKKQNPAWP